MGLLPRELEIACIDPHQTWFVCKGSDRLQLIKFWPSRAPRKGVCGEAKIFGSALQQPARSVCVSLSAFLFYFCSRMVTVGLLAQIAEGPMGSNTGSAICLEYRYVIGLISWADMKRYSQWLK